MKQLIQDLGAGRTPAGVIATANENRFDAAHMSEPLTAYAVGYPDEENLQAMLDLLFAPVAVQRKFQFRKAKEAEAYVSELDDIRAIGDKGFARVSYSGTTSVQQTYNKGLTEVLDKDEIVEGDEERAVARLIARLRRNDLRRALTMLDSACTNVAKTWTAAADPDMDVMSEMETGNVARGIPANRIIYGSTAWLKRQIALRGSDKSGAFASAGMTQEQLASLLGVDTVSVCKELFKAGKGKDNTQFMAAYVYILCNQSSADREDPSNCKRFYTPTGDGAFRVYREETVKTIEISVEHYSNLVITNNLGLRRITVS